MDIPAPWPTAVHQYDRCFFPSMPRLEQPSGTRTSLTMSTIKGASKHVLPEHMFVLYTLCVREVSVAGLTLVTLQRAIQGQVGVASHFQARRDIRVAQCNIQRRRVWNMTWLRGKDVLKDWVVRERMDERYYQQACASKSSAVAKNKGGVSDRSSAQASNGVDDISI